MVNMRGVHDTGLVFMIPTYLFAGTLLIVIAVGAVKRADGGIRTPVTAVACACQRRPTLSACG